MVTKSSSNTPTGISGTILQGQGAGVDLALSTATYPDTTTVSQILHSSSTNVVSGITTANNGVLITSTSGVPSILAAGSTGQVLTATTSSAPSWQTPASNSSALYSNLGIAYNGGTGVFKITSESGAALSATNYATIKLPSIANPGLLVTYTVTADQSFIDDVGASNIIGNLFGYTTGIAITDDVPFFIYAVAKTDETAIAFMLSRVPHKPISPAAANIGVPGTPGTNAQTSMFSIPAITAADYAVSPCVCVGAIRMKMSAANDWTVQTLSTVTKTEGIGAFLEENLFNIPLGQLGANASTVTRNNGGTAAVFGAVLAQYFIKKNGICLANYQLTSDGGTDGAGAVNATFMTPYTCQVASFGICRGIVAGATQSTYLLYQIVNSSSFNINNSNSENLLWSAFTNANRAINGSLTFEVSV